MTWQAWLFLAIAVFQSLLIVGYYRLFNTFVQLLAENDATLNRALDALNEDCDEDEELDS